MGCGASNVECQASAPILRAVQPGDSGPEARYFIEYLTENHHLISEVLTSADAVAVKRGLELLKAIQKEECPDNDVRRDIVTNLRPHVETMQQLINDKHVFESSVP
eukprot:TRINITY_DN8276_c0_g1_i1.p1 TRINITY_DN8276_c0_g1~~TRINITY_DN8276_c0_g1_i1.p1  ORF type:complete len:106 (+),score=17.40 TRINITY_DN8276_c0_g1_i1:111-428(+)